MTLQGNTLVKAVRAISAGLKLEFWNGDVFIANLMSTGQFGHVVDVGT